LAQKRGFEIASREQQVSPSAPEVIGGAGLDYLRFRLIIEE
jgi:hypothetical protein